MEISTTKTEILAFQGKSPVRSKTVLSDKWSEEASTFK
jgi:hypothetical protein